MAWPVTSLRGLYAEHLGDVGELVSHLLDAGGEFGRPADVDHLPGGLELLPRCVGSARDHRLHVGGDLFADFASGMPRGPKMPPMLSIPSAG